MALDDHPVVLEGLRHLLVSRLEGVECDGVSCRDDMLALIGGGRSYDLFILDLELADDDGFKTVAAIRRLQSGAAILIYTMHEEPWLMAKLAKLDIQGFVSKDSEVERLTEAVDAIMHGRVSFGEPLAGYLGSADSGVASVRDTAALSQREQQVLALIARGMTTQQIADELFVSTNTIGTYRHRLMSKLGAHNVAQLIAWKHSLES